MLLNLYTVSHKKVSTFKLPVTLSYLNRFSKIFALLESILNLLQNPYDITHLTLAMLLHYLAVQNIDNQLRFNKVTESLKVETFLRHSVYSQVDMTSLKQAYYWQTRPIPE